MFGFTGCIELREMLGRSAWDERELLIGIEEVPGDSIFYHTHSYFLRSRYLAAPYPNDFATWAAIQVRDRVLGERLAVIDPFEFADVETLRAEIITVIDTHLAALQMIPRVVYGQPFEFMRSTIIEIPTGIAARTLQEFRDALERVDLSVIYYHFFEPVSRRRHDPASWLEHALGLPHLAAQVGRLNPYVGSLEGFRARLIALCDEALGKTPDA
ncbi:MAG: hypothetical protein HY660_12535 [Armatimonadetes bacterium]|nr:hypothetical protein [Armatimonadota bacterium]